MQPLASPAKSSSQTNYSLPQRKNRQTQRRKRINRWLLFILPLLILCGLHLWSQFLNFYIFVDDAYIYFACAQNLVAGFGPVVNPGERVEGFSSVLWLLLCTIPFLAHFDPVLFIKILGTALGMVAVFLAWLYSTRSLRISPFYSFLGVALFSLNTEIAKFFTFGLETPLFTVLVLLALITSNQTGRRSLLAALVVGMLLPLARPEGFLYFPAILICLFLSYCQAKGFRVGLRVSLLSAVVLAGTFILISGARFLIFGQLFPNTYYAKSRAMWVSRQTGWLALAAIFANLGGPAILTFLSGIGIGLRARRTWITVIRPGLFLLTGMFFVWHASHDWMGLYRLVAPVYPIFCILLGWAGQAVWNYCRGGLERRRRMGVMTPVLSGLAATLLLAVFGHALVRSTAPAVIAFNWKKQGEQLSLFSWPSLSGYAGFAARDRAIDNLRHGEFREQTYETIVSPLLQVTRPGYEAMIPDVGLAAYASRTEILDTKGLLNRSTADLFYYHVPTDASEKRQQASLRARDRFKADFLRRKPEIVMLNVRLDPSGKPFDPVFDAERYVLEMPEFERLYTNTGLATAGERGRNHILFRRIDVAPLLPEEIAANYSFFFQKNPRSPFLAEELVRILFAPQKNAQAARLLHSIYLKNRLTRHFR